MYLYSSAMQNFDPHFTRWFNDRFAGLMLEKPDPSSDPCYDEQGRVIARGPWDRGPTFSKRGRTFRFLRHQQLIHDYFVQNPLTRGVLLFHGLGSGKTLTSLSVAEALKTERSVVLMSPAALKTNFIDELKKFTNSNEDDERFLSRMSRAYSFVSYDAPNTPQQIRNIHGGLDNKMIIVDEVHNMISMINKRSKKGVFLFEEIMNASDVKLIFLSGTPIINDPFEIAIIANLLTGFIKPKTGEIIAAPRALERHQKKMLFGDNVDFYYYFVDSRNPDLPQLTNLMALKHRLVGTISYYAGLQPQRKILPEVTEHTHLIEMSPRQHELYEIVRKPERETEKKIRKRMANTAKAKKFGKATVNLEMMFRPEGETNLSNFCAQSRQFCNFVFPPELPRYVPGFNDINALDDDRSASRRQHVHAVSDNGLDASEDVASYDEVAQRAHAESLRLLDLDSQRYLVDELPTHSPKWVEMLRVMQESQGPIYVYSQFRELAGVNVFAAALRAHGYIQYGFGDPEVSPTPMNPLPYTRDAVTGRLWRDLTAKERNAFQPLTYMFWPKSSANSDRKSHLMRVFNSHENRHGKLIRVFLSTKSGAEGLNLMNVRQVHIMEPYWNLMRVKQAIGRAVRQCSHAALPPTQRRVDVHHYMMTIDTFSSPDKGPNGKMQSTDQYVHAIAAQKQHIINTVEKVMKEVAVDCKVNYNHNRLQGEYTCYDPVGEQAAPALDLAQAQTDREVYSEYKVRHQDMIQISLGNAGKYRVQKEDKAIIDRFLRKEFGAGEKREVLLFHILNNEPALVMELVQGRAPMWRSYVPAA